MKLIPVSEAKARLTELVKTSKGEDVVLLRYGKPAAVLMSTERFDALMERLEDLEDSVELFNAADEPTEDLDVALRREGVRVPQRA